MVIKERSIWKNIGFALAVTPLVLLVSLILITLVGALDDVITKMQLAGQWWLILIGAYILSLIYFVYKPRIQQNYERKKVVDGLILYWKEQLEKQVKSQPSDKETELVRKMLIERIKVWAWFDPKLWKKYFPNEKYSKYLFGVMDNFMAYYQNQKKV